VSRLLPLLLALSACAGGPSKNEATTDNEVQPANAAAITNQVVAAADTAVEATIPDDDPGLKGMSASRRRAYEQGFRDCSAGRYNPDPYPEAYRIGCGAAQEQEGGGAGR